ncbi:MAG: hypothetical protein HC834_07365 [Rhodospirillales bacterium]|nr:hypothetical protein [Rhodospirillales bacterium]
MLNSATAAAPAFQPPANPPRFLILVERSSAGRAMAEEIRQTVFDLVYHAANGHMPDGSVFELWTFGEETTYRGFTPQMLTPDNHLKVASLASAYVNASTNRGPADIAELAGHVRELAGLGYELTLLLVTAPDTRLTGTSRDEPVNGFFEANAARMNAERRPFITGFRVQDGEIKAHSVSDSAFTMQLPPMPESTLTDEERNTRFAAARQARAELNRPPPTANPSPVVTRSEPAPRLDPNVPDEQQPGAIILRGNPKPVVPVAPPVETDAVTTGSSSPTTPGTETPQPAVPPVQTETPVKIDEAGATPDVSTTAKAIAATSDVPSDTPSGPTNVPAVEPVGVDPVAAPPAGSPPPSPMVAHPGTWLTAGGLFIAGLCFFIVAGLLAWVLMRRARAAAGPSYITRSIDGSRRTHTLTGADEAGGGCATCPSSDRGELPMPRMTQLRGCASARWFGA